MPRSILCITSIGASREALAPCLGDALFAADIRLQLEVVRSAEEATALAAACEVDRVVAIGGDGTLGAVATGLMRQPDPPELALVPMGTANDFAGSVGLRDLPLAQAVRQAIQGTARPLDVGLVDDTAFLNMLSVGFPAELSTTTPRPLKDAVGGLAYALHGLANVDRWQATPMAVAAEGHRWEGPAFAVFVCNGRQAGGGNVIAPEARVDDGLFDVVIVPELTPGEIIPVAVRAQLGEEIQPERVITWRVRSVTIEADSPTPTTADGEAQQRHRMRAELVPGALAFVRG